MFIGAINKKVCWQLVQKINFDAWGKVYVGCSGSFRIEEILKNAYPNLMAFSNDVSFLSCAIGYAATGRKFRFKYSGDLDFLSCYNGDDPLYAIASAGIVLDYSSCSLNFEYGRKKRVEIQNQKHEIFEKNLSKAQNYISKLHIDGFYPDDFHNQIRRAKENDGGFICYAPTYKGGYEKQYKLLNANTEWDAPTYDLWDPKHSEELVAECEKNNIPYCYITDRLLEGYTPKMVYRGSGNPVYTYAECNSSIRLEKKKITPFRYQVVQPEKLTEKSKCEVYSIPNENIAFLKTVYLAKGINFKTGMANFVVMIDGMLAGGITVQETQYGDKNTEIYLLSDFSLSRERKLSKLIAMQATGRDLIKTINARYMIKVQRVYTTAFTTKAVSMKYRGIFELVGRKPGMLNYMSNVREMSAQEIYADWWRKYGRKP